MTVVSRITSASDLEAALQIRYRVFVDEQGVPLEEERDSYDDTALHLLARVDGAAAGTARLVVLPASGKVGRVAVLPEFRGQGIGEALMAEAHALAAELGLPELVLDAQVQVIGFYEKLGYTAEGPEFLDAGILHRRMTWRRGLS